MNPVKTKIEKPMRSFREGEAFCKYGCKTFINTRDGADGQQGHCGMCCDKATVARARRVAPIHAAEVAAIEAATEAQRQRIAARQEAALVAALPPTPVMLPEQHHNKHRR